MKNFAVLLSIVVMTATASAQTIFSDRGETAWAQYHKQLFDYMGGNGGIVAPNVLQPLAIAQRVEWDTQKVELNLYFKQFIGNQSPEWGPLYIPGISKVSNGYRTLIDSLNSSIISGNAFPNQKKLETLDKERTRLRDKLDDLQTDVNKRWVTYLKKTPANQQQTRSKWEEDKGYTADLQNLEGQLQATQAAYALAVNDANGPDLKELGRAIAALGNKTQQLPLPSSDELYPLGKDAWEYYYRTFLDGDIFQFKNDASPITFTMKQGVQETTGFSKTWHASARVGWCCFFSASGSTESEDRSKQAVNETSEIKISFKNIKPFNITRGQWFDGNLVKKYINRIEKSFWGPTGELSLIPQQLILGHGMAVDITTSKEVSDYIYNRHQVSGGGGFSIGPFSFGGGGGSTTTYEHTKVTQTATGLHIEDTSGRAVVLAVVSMRPADFIAGPPDPNGTHLLPLALTLEKLELDKGKEMFNSIQKESTEEPLEMLLVPK